MMMKKIICVVAALAALTLIGIFLMKKGADEIRSGEVSSEVANNSVQYETELTVGPLSDNERAEKMKETEVVTEIKDTTAAEDNDDVKDEEEKSGTEYAPDRIIYREGFSKEPLSDEIRDRITGVSYHENDDISYEDLSFLKIRYKDFEGNEQNGEMICNKLIADDLLEIFAQLYENGYEIDKIRLIDEYGADDDLSCEDDNTSCFNYRRVAGTDRLSNHALGLAVDINPFYNPYITYKDSAEKISPPGSERYADRSRMEPHMIDEDDLCYRLFKEHGFTWGGSWKSVKDYQHFEKK